MGMRKTGDHITVALQSITMPQEHKTPPRPRSWRSKPVRWGSLACLLVLLFAWGWSRSHSLTIVHNSRTVTWFSAQLSIETSRLWTRRWSVATAEYNNPTGGYYGFRFGPDYTFGDCAIGSKDSIVIPLWFVLLPVGAATLLAWSKPVPAR